MAQLMLFLFLFCGLWVETLAGTILCSTCVDDYCLLVDLKPCNSSCYVNFKQNNGDLERKGCHDNLLRKGPKTYKYRKLGPHQCSEYEPNIVQCLCYSDGCNDDHHVLIDSYANVVREDYPRKRPKYDSQIYPTEPPTTHPPSTTQLPPYYKGRKSYNSSPSSSDVTILPMVISLTLLVVLA